MADMFPNRKGEYVCVSLGFESVSDSLATRDTNPGKWYIVEVNCEWGIPCSAYPDGYELSCVVCTK